MTENKKLFNNNCFAPNWLEVDLEAVANKTSKEVITENTRRKDLNTLLRELEDIKQNIENVAEKQHRLANLMKFYSANFVGN